MGEDLGKDDSLGSTSIDVTSVQKQKQLHNLWIPLNNCKSGEIFLSAEFIPLGCAQAQNYVKVIPESINASGHAIEVSPHIKTDDKKLIEKAADQASTVPASETMVILEKGHIVITVYKARDIEKKGMVGKADPYVNITLGEQKAKSATIQNNHNPEWNFKAAFEVDENSNGDVTIAVFDEDFGKDDSLGSTTLEISSIQALKHLENQWMPLDKCKSGEVLLSAEFIPFGNIKAKEIIKEIS